MFLKVCSNWEPPPLAGIPFLEFFAPARFLALPLFAAAFFFAAISALYRSKARAHRAADVNGSLRPGSGYLSGLKDLYQVMHPAASVAKVKGGRAKADFSAEDLLDALDEEGRVEAE